MTVATLTPNATVTSSGVTVTGAANEHSALSDSSDASYVAWAGSSPTLELGLSDLSLPGGAVITRVAAVIRDRVAATAAKNLTAQIEGFASVDTVSVSWETFATHVMAVNTAPSYGAITDADVDAALLLIGSTGPLALAEASVAVTYVAQPVTDATAPSGTINNTNTPSVRWTNTLDSDGGTQAKYEVKIFSAAQYGAGGFDPATSSPTETSGITNSAATTWLASDPFPDATYRAYVRVAQSVLGSDHWSDWDYVEFTVAPTTPGVPTIAAVAEDDEGRIWLTLDDTPGAGTTDAFEVQRSIDAGASWETIRTTDGGRITATSGIGRAYDTEVGNGVTVLYRARALHIDSEFDTYSAWSASTTATAWQSRSWWLKSPSYPDLNIPVEVGGVSALEQDAGQGVFQPLGRRRPIVVSETRSGFRGTVRFVFDDAPARAEFDELLDLAEPLLLQAPPTDSWDDRFVMLGNLNRGRGFDKSWVDWNVDTLPWVEVDAPTGDVVEWPAFGS